MRLFAFIGMSVALFSAPALAIECRISEFKFDYSGSISEVKMLSYLSFMTKVDWENNRSDIGGSASYGKLFSADMTYDQMKEKVNQEINSNHIDKFNEFRESWAETSLDQNGLSAYRACLQSSGGFYVTVSSLSANLSKLIVDWFPSTDRVLNDAPEIIDSSNVKNTGQIQKIMSRYTYGTQAVTQEIRLIRQIPDQEASITIRAGRQSKLIYIPPPPPPWEPPRPPVITLHVTGWIESKEAGRERLNFEAEDYDFVIPFHDTYKDFLVTVTQYDDGRRCGGATITPSAIAWPPGTTMSATPRFVRTFQMGGQVRGGRTLQVFTYPQFCTDTEPSTPPALGG